MLGHIFLLLASFHEAPGTGGYEDEDLGGRAVSRCYLHSGKSRIRHGVRNGFPSGRAVNQSPDQWWLFKDSLLRWEGAWPMFRLGDCSLQSQINSSHLNFPPCGLSRMPHPGPRPSVSPRMGFADKPLWRIWGDDHVLGLRAAFPIM